MNLIIASDIHGSALYCRRLREAFAREKGERLLLLGDLLYHGPRNDLPEGYAPKQTAAYLNALKNRVLAVRGNCEAEVDQMMLNFPVLADYALIALEDRLIFATHGHHFNLEHLPPLAPGDILLCGHTHVPAWTAFGKNNLYFNPGSVSIPKQQSPRGYIQINGRDVLWKTLDGVVYHSAAL